MYRQSLVKFIEVSEDILKQEELDYVALSLANPLWRR